MATFNTSKNRRYFVAGVELGLNQLSVVGHRNLYSPKAEKASKELALAKEKITPAMRQKLEMMVKVNFRSKRLEHQRVVNLFEHLYTLHIERLLMVCENKVSWVSTRVH